MANDTQKDATDYVTDYRVAANDSAKEKYNVKNYTYPIDLLSEAGVARNEYGYNYVMFFINVSTDSKIIKEGKAPTVSDTNISPRKRAAIVGRNTDSQITKEVVAGSAAGVGVLSDILAATLNLPIAGAGTKSGAIAAGALLLTGDQIGEFTRPQKRLQTAIALHVPNQLNVRYGINWQEDETSLFTYATSGGAEVAKALEATANYYTSDGASGGNLNQLKNLGGMAQTILAANVLNASSGVSASTGLAQNPNKEQLFQGVDFRTFQMDYQFFPRSEEEAKNVLNIIQQFKYHMHPEFKDQNNFIYIYPSEFDIAYYNGSEENKSLHRHSSCVLTDLSVNYTPNGVFTTFANGMPTQINMVLTFRELVQLTKDQIREGF